MPRWKREKVSRSRSNKSRHGRKRRVNNHAESPVKKHSRKITEKESPMATDPCVCDRGEPENCLSEMVETTTTRDLENGSVESEITEILEDRGIFLPLVLNGFQNPQNDADTVASKKRSADDAELEDSDRSCKRRSLDFRMNSLHISPTKNQMIPWHLLHERDDSRISRRYPERYWVPNEWVESLDYR